jgi:hypothetical protein
MNMINSAVVLGALCVLACKGTANPAEQPKPVATKIGVTLMLAGKTEETADPSPNGTYLSGDFGGIHLEVVSSAPDPATVTGPDNKPLVNAKTERLADGFVITFGDDKTAYGVSAFRTIGGKVIRCGTSGNPLERAQREIVDACKSMK